MRTTPALLVMTLALTHCSSKSGAGVGLLPGAAADAELDVGSDAMTEDASDVGAASGLDAAAVDASDVADVAIVCGAATPAECTKCGAPPTDKLLCHGCPFQDPPPECYAVCSATICYECGGADSSAPAWNLVNYDCVKSDVQDAKIGKDAANTNIAIDAATPDAAGGQAGDPCGDSDQLACAEPLLCCYPCGIPGCHNKCTQPCTGPACGGGCPLNP